MRYAVRAIEHGSASPGQAIRSLTSDKARGLPLRQNRRSPRSISGGDHREEFPVRPPSVRP
jgi:hypothetical protein